MINTSISAGEDLEDWYLRYASRLRRAARRIVGNEPDAEDATQDAFLAAFRAHDRYRRGIDPYPWLCRIATRKALTIAARRRVAPNDGETRPADAAVPSAEDEALAADAARAVRSLVAMELPVKLHLVDGLRLRDVGERLGIPTATAATRIRRGKHRLRSLLAANFPDEATASHTPRSKTA